MTASMATLIRLWLRAIIPDYDYDDYGYDYAAPPPPPPPDPQGY